MPPFQALYGRPCRTPLCWDEVIENLVLGPDYLEQTKEDVLQIRRNMKAAQDRQKSYADIRRRELEFAVDDQVFLRVSPMKGIFRFGQKGKLSPKYVGPYRITEPVGPLAYRLDLPAELGRVHECIPHFSAEKVRASPFARLGAREARVRPRPQIRGSTHPYPRYEDKRDQEQDHQNGQSPLV